jgi:hypothetical protein
MNKSVFAAVAAAAVVAGGANADLVNGGFDDGGTGWDFFGGQGLFDPSFLPGNAVVAYGTFAPGTNFSGVTQTLGWAGEFAEGDTINFGGDMYLESAKVPYGTNRAVIQLNFWYGGGYDYGFSVVAGVVDASSATDQILSFNLDYVLDAGAASATRISFDYTYIQDGFEDGVESGAIWGDNFYASIVPAPGAMALLGVAGLARGRRRD